MEYSKTENDILSKLKIIPTIINSGINTFDALKIFCATASTIRAQYSEYVPEDTELWADEQLLLKIFIHEKLITQEQVDAASIKKSD